MSDFGSRVFEPDRPYFICDPDDEGMLYFETAEARNKYARTVIERYLDPVDAIWSEGVENIHVGVVTGCADKVNYRRRPPDIELEEGVDGTGTSWAPDVDAVFNIEINSNRMAKALLDV